MAVVDSPAGGLELVRFPLVPGHVADTIAARTTHLRRTIHPGSARFFPPTVDGRTAPPPPPARLTAVPGRDSRPAVAA
ncbi:hypothetical protein [Jiangella endophytica]|uniref:hypothetical protein n=1 Tax=Jiangella endophytica TaxID=1623398 RepID=UPI000E350863|nr:hypothetical protein [Jiangella endophytica]